MERHDNDILRGSDAAAENYWTEARHWRASLMEVHNFQESCGTLTLILLELNSTISAEIQLLGHCGNRAVIVFFEQKKLAEQFGFTTVLIL